MTSITVEQAMAMAVEHHRAGRLAEAAEIYRQILGHDGGYVQAQANLAIALAQMGNWRDAESPARAATELMPDHAAFQCNLGNILRELGKLPEAESALRRAIVIDGNLAEAYANLGQVLYGQRRLRDSVDAYRSAITLNPALVEPLNGLGVTLRELREPAEAMECFNKALVLDPACAMAHSNLGMSLSDSGRNEEAERAYRAALGLEPGNARFGSNLVYHLNVLERPPREVFREHVQWAQKHETPLAGERRVPTNDRTASRRLRIGYVSPDFREHSVSYFLEPILANHDHGNFEIHCFADEIAPDETTTRLRGYADQWHPITALNDHEAAEHVRQSEIDVLVDLAAHTAHGRLQMFARKPAPVQVTYLGYPNTTGMKTMDYRLTDAYADPLGLADELHTEQLWRLPRTFLCYRPPKDEPAVAELPAIKSGHLTFGYFGSANKLNARMLTLWSRILKGNARSRLLLKMRGEPARVSLMNMLDASGVPRYQVQFVPQTQGRREHLEQHGLIDIALDSYPYNGTTTTCEALSMGVPVVSLAGSTHVSRVGASLLSSIGLGELVASSDAEYVQKASELALDVTRLAELRRGMRPRLEKSPLMDQVGFTRDLEKAYREMWTAWCKR